MATFLIQKRENCMMWTQECPDLELAIDVAKDIETGRVWVENAQEELLWENDEQKQFKFPKEIFCHLYRNSKANLEKTIVEIRYKNLIEPGHKELYKGEVLSLWYLRRAKAKELQAEGFRESIRVSMETGEEVGECLGVGVSVLDGDISPQDFIELNTSYRWVHERMKSATESVGFGQLPGSIGRFEKISQDLDAFSE